MLDAQFMRASRFGRGFRTEVGLRLKAEKCRRRSFDQPRLRNPYDSKPQGVAGNAALPPYFEGSL
jgi:hypothetical protein